MIYLTLPLPPSINRTYKTGNGRFYKSHKAHAWTDEALWKIKKQKQKPEKGLYWVLLAFYFDRDSDIDSRLKSVLDVLQKSGLIANDMEIVELQVSKHAHDAQPRVEVNILGGLK